tara:strand:- start:152 stop:418 length:267 start_codon:yes stop_codon:yes gene_type:complete
MSWYSDELRRLRMDQNMSLQQVADKSGSTKSYVSQVELGKRKPSFELVETMAKALGATIYIKLENPELPPAIAPKNKKRASIASRFIL